MHKKDKPKVQVVPYDPQWPQVFALETIRLAALFGENYVQAYHIGSTAVPGLWAKPVLDMIVAVHDLRAAKKATPCLTDLGYSDKGEAGIPFHLYFHREDCHLHIFEKDSPEIDHAVCFRNWLRVNDEDARAYETLKRHLSQLYPQDLSSYGRGKNAFIKALDAKTGFKGLRMVSLLSQDEKEAYERLAAHGVGDRFVFYKAGHIVGAGCVGQVLEVWMKEDCFKERCLALLERWAHAQKDVNPS